MSHNGDASDGSSDATPETSTAEPKISGNAGKKARQFDFQAILQETLHAARTSYSSASGGTYEPTDDSDSIAEEPQAGPSAVEPKKESEETAETTSDAPELSKEAHQNDEEEESDEEVTVTSLIPAAYETNIVHGQKAVYSLTFDSQGSKFATGGQNYAVQLYDFQKMDSTMKAFREVYPCEAHVINCLAYSANGENLAVASGEAQIRLLDRIGKQWSETVRGDQYLVDLARTKGHTASVNHVCWHPLSKNEFMSCSDDGSLRIWSTEDHKVITKCINTQRHVIKTRSAGGRRVIPTACCYSRDGKWIAAGCDDGSIQVWKNGNSFSTPKYLNRTAHSGAVCCMEFSPDSKKILSRGMDDSLKLFEVENIKKPFKEVTNLSCMFVQSSCGYSPHGEFVFATTSVRKSRTEESGQLLFFNSETLELAYRIDYPHAGAVSCVWHPKLDQILVGLSDGTCKMYYDPRSSVRGAMLCATKPVKRARANELVKEEMIIAPLALDMFQPRGEEGEEKEITEWRIKRVLRMQSGKKKPQFRKPGEMPMSGHSAGGRIASSGGSLHSYIAQQLGKSQNQTFIQDEDIRASILRHAEAAEKEPMYISKAYKRTQPKPIFQEAHDDDDDDQDEPEFKAKKLN